MAARNPVVALIVRSVVVIRTTARRRDNSAHGSTKLIMSGSGFDGLNPTMTGLGFGKLEYLGVRPEPARRNRDFHSLAFD